MTRAILTSAVSALEAVATLSSTTDIIAAVKRLCERVMVFNMLVFPLIYCQICASRFAEPQNGHDIC
jgi:hypothetical protein